MVVNWNYDVPLLKPIKLILEFYYMSNGLTFEIFNIIFLNFHRR